MNFKQHCDFVDAQINRFTYNRDAKKSALQECSDLSLNRINYHDDALREDVDYMLNELPQLVEFDQILMNKKNVNITKVRSQSAWLAREVASKDFTSLYEQIAQLTYFNLLHEVAVIKNTEVDEVDDLLKNGTDIINNLLNKKTDSVETQIKQTTVNKHKMMKGIHQLRLAKVVGDNNKILDALVVLLGAIKNAK